ncbi:MAG: caspase family protein [Scytonematopsis contorta HA4267-MV1]|jgi:WD40 repeat protein/uncharacterized caspase-like protein/energy-coupling factor transporter ATP-binding protein EcfA2|nr:caspase family protein [Scytonematopsis contorta HA4267-MV1]
MSPVSVATSSSNQAKQLTPKLWLILVGVKQYEDEEIPNLRYSAEDCQVLADALVEATTQFTQIDLKIHHDFALQSPSLESVRESLVQIATAANSSDTILFYFSGHGILEPNTQDVYLCLAETQKSDLQKTGLALQEILHLLGSCNAQNQLIWLDACHSGGMTLRSTNIDNTFNPTLQLVEVLQQRAAQSKGFYALLSCDNNQQSWEFPELEHGVFTYYLTRGLQGEAADSQGIISADGLYRYVYHNTLQYIDKTNQQLRLINQQKKSKGDTKLRGEYPLQTPKRIVEGVGELILGKRQEDTYALQQCRVGTVIEGLSASKSTLELSKLFKQVGLFGELEYLQATKVNADDVKEAITSHLQLNSQLSKSSSQDLGTILLYLRFKIEETEAGEWLLFGEDIRIKRSWLKQQLRSCKAKQIVILDCLEINNYSQAHPALSLPVAGLSLQNWVEDLQIDSQQGQCLIACASPNTEPEFFAETLFKILTISSVPDGLSAASLIAQLQIKLAGSRVPLHIWLSGTQGIIEILPANSDFQAQNQGLDLGICPYMGLSAFSEEDTQYFYGRESLTQEIVHEIAKSAFTAVIGASGSGKSSVVQAGAIPALKQGKQIPNSEQWVIKTLRPGANPLEALIQKLGVGNGELGMGNWEWGIGNNKISPSSSSSSSPSSPPTPHSPLPTPQLEGILHLGVESFVYWIRNHPCPFIVLVVDQFEELFTLAPATDREKFLELLLGAIEYAGDRFKLIITLRADFIASCLEIPALAKLLQHNSVLIPPRLSLDDYRRVIINPARQVGLKVEPELVEILLRELDRSAGDLPLLEFVLEQLWHHRVNGELTLKAYQEKLGGIKGALERSSQEVYENLDPQAQECAKWIFLSLTQLGEGTEDTRRRVNKSELIVKKYPVDLVEKTLQIFTAAKLVVMNLEEEYDENLAAGKGDFVTQQNVETVLTRSLQNGNPSVTVEVAHEILIRHWSTLRWWLEENRARLRSQRQIEQAAQLWKENNKHSDFLLQGVRFVEAEDVYIKYTDELSEDIQEFIVACLEERKRQQFLAKKQVRQRIRAISALSILGLATLGLGGLAYWKFKTALLRDVEALHDSSRANILSHQQLEALIDNVKAGRIVKQAFNVPEEVKFNAQKYLQKTLAEIKERNRLEGHEGAVTYIDISPDRKIIASASDDKTVKLWQRDGKLIHTLTGHKNDVKSVHFSPDGSTIATVSFYDGIIKIWKTSDGTEIRTIPVGATNVLSVAWSPQGNTIAVATNNKFIKILRISDGYLLSNLKTNSPYLSSIAFSPDGKTLASGNWDKGDIIQLWNISNGRLIDTLRGHTQKISTIAFSLDGTILASGGEDKTIKLWKLSDNTLIKSIPAHNGEVLSVNFSPDGKTLVSGSLDSTIKLWNAVDGSLIQTLSGHSTGVFSVKFIPNSQTLVSASGDQTVRIWKWDDALIKTIKAHKEIVYTVRFNHRGNIIASTGSDTKVKLWRAKEGSLQKELSGHQSQVYSLNFSPDGNTIASSDSSSIIKLWRITDNSLITDLKGHTSEVNSVSFSPDGKILASASRDKTVKLWDVNSRKIIHTLKGHEKEVLSVVFSPKGDIVASTGKDNSIKIWRVKDGELLQDIKDHTNMVNSLSFNPEGDILASASTDKTIKLWKISDSIHLLQTLTGHQDAVWGVAFSPDGQIIASGSSDNTVKLWSLNGIELQTLEGHSNWVTNVSFNPNGKTLASSSVDGSIKIWDVSNIKLQTSDLNNLLVRSCDWLHDYLKNNPKVSREDKRSCF